MPAKDQQCDHSSLVEWYAQNCEKKIRDASVAAESGNVSSMETALILARTYTERSGRFLNEIEVRRIEEKGYLKGIEKEFRKAVLRAKKGDAASMEKGLELVRGYARKANFVLNEGELEMVAREGYSKGVKQSPQKVCDRTQNEEAFSC